MGKWKFASISEIASVNMGQSPDSSFINDLGQGMPFLQGNAEFGKLHPCEQYWCINPIKIADAGDLLVSVRAPVGEINLADKQYCIGRGLSAINFWGVNNEFARYAFFMNVLQLHIKSQGTTFLAVSKKDIDNIILHYPVEQTEQRKIAEILTTVDEVIDNTRILIDKYTNIKKGMMQDLLINGVDTPISQLCKIISGSTPSTSDESFWNGSHVWITPNDLSNLTIPYIKTSARKLSNDGVKQATGILLPANSIIISNRAPVGYCAVVSVPFTFNQGCKGLICNPDTDPLYLYYCLKQSTPQLEKVSSGTIFLELPKRELSRFIIRIPKTFNEQRTISNQIFAADTKIKTECDYLDKLLDIKKGLMHDLLTNTISVDPLL